MKKNISVFLFLFLVLLSLRSQTLNISGEVKDVSGVLPGVVVTVTTDDVTNVISYGITDDSGKFLLKKIDLEKGKFVIARFIGYATQRVPLVKDKTFYSIFLKEKAVQLKEVKIKAAKITGSGDTIRYYASSFAKKNDVTLGDVLKRMPGFQLSDEGRLKYQGKEISDFYVEGSNIMGDKYPIAVNSIHQNDVGSVEVLENHQSIKLFDDLLYSDKTAVNITLKEKAKNRWVGALNIGGGVPNLWSVDVNAMRFAKKIKMLDTYKGNNTGNDVSDIGNPFLDLSGGAGEDAREIITVQNASNPFLEKRKTLFNKSHLLSLNNQVLLSKSFILTPQLNLSRSSFDNDEEEDKTYFLEGGKTLDIFTREKGLLKKWQIDPTVRLEANTQEMYFNNVLSANVVHKENEVSVTGTYPNSKNSDMDYANICNDFDMLFRIGQKVIGVKSKNRWSRRPQDMQIKQDDLFVDEHLKTEVFNSQTSANQVFSFGKYTFSLDEGYSFSTQLLKSRLSGIEELYSSNVSQNNFHYHTALLYAKPSLAANLGVLKTTFSIPVSYNSNKYTDKYAGQAYSKNKWLISPSVSAMWVINKKYTLSCSGGWKKEPESPLNFYASPMLSSYPFMQTGLLNFNDTETANAGFLIRYKNILRGLFCNGGYNRLWQHSDLMNAQNLNNEYVIMGLAKNPHTATSDNFFANLNYMINQIKGGVSLKGSYSVSHNHFLQDEVQQYTISKNKQLSANIYSSPSSSFDLNYTFTFSENTYRQKGKSEQSSNSIHQVLSLTLAPLKKGNVVLTGNHYNNALESGHKDLFLVDAAINYKLSQQWNFQLLAQNIFNEKEFSYVSYTEMMAVERKYQIRPYSLLFSVITHF